MYWLSTVRPDGRPHVTPLVAVWLGRCPVLHHRLRRAQGQEPGGEPFLRRHHRLQRSVRGPRPRLGQHRRDRRATSQAPAGGGWLCHEVRRHSIPVHRARDGAFPRRRGGEVPALFGLATPTRAFGGRGESFSATRWLFTAFTQLGEERRVSLQDRRKPSGERNDGAHVEHGCPAGLPVVAALPSIQAALLGRLARPLSPRPLHLRPARRMPQSAPRALKRRTRSTTSRATATHAAAIVKASW